MGEMFSTIIANFSTVFLVLVIMISIIYAAKKDAVNVLKSIALEVVTEAEKIYGDGTGELKLAYAVDLLYQNITGIAKLFIDNKDITKIVEDALADAKILWYSKKDIQEYIDS